MGRQSLSEEGMHDADEELGAAYEAYAGPIYRFFFWRTQDKAVSQDLTSGVFEKAWRSRHSFKGGSIRAWLYRIARNSLIDHWRTTRTIALDETPELVSDAEEPAAVVDKQLQAERLHRAVNRLPQEMRLVVRLRFMEGMPSKRVARATGLTESNVRVIQYRALKKLRTYLDE
jgi:RNA polymerase sigma-70 factor, ECF subfamily